MAADCAWAESLLAVRAVTYEHMILVIDYSHGFDEPDNICLIKGGSNGGLMAAMTNGVVMEASTVIVRRFLITRCSFKSSSQSICVNRQDFPMKTILSFNYSHWFM